ncbi:MAG: hypothetical protein Q8P24_03670 [Desulfobacterales bacterium]|nr:hypothetical protein [Desulfobacterales bacterium]
MKLTFESDFVESAVFLAIRQNEAEGSGGSAKQWHTQRDKIYAVKDTQSRAKAFRELDEEWFIRLGLRQRFDSLLNVFPILEDTSLVIRIRRALSRKDEGSELYIQGKVKTNLIKFQTVRLFEADYLEKFLHHEWLRVSDMLDPVFQYSPHAALSGASELEDNLIRDRYRLLWEFYVSIRLLKMGFRILTSLTRQKQLMDRAFSKWTAEAREKILWEIANQKHQTQSDFLKLAKDEKLMVPLGQGGLLCPLCHFTSFDPADLSFQQNPMVIEEIKRDHPNWNIDWGICQNCFDLYQSKPRVAV